LAGGGRVTPHGRKGESMEVKMQTNQKAPEHHYRVVEIFMGNYGVMDYGALVISGFRTWQDAFDWMVRRTENR